MEEKYFVGSDGEKPLQIFFDSIEAFVSGYLYIDSFDETGSLVNSYEFIDGRYTEDF